MTVLYTAFEPFDGALINASYEVMKRLTPHHDVHHLLLPVSLKKAWPLLQKTIHEHRPHTVLATGLASGRKLISLERIAINCLDFSIPDNDGFQVQDQLIELGSPDGLFSNLPLRKLLNHLRLNGIPCEISNSAGTYLCNYIMYRLMLEANHAHFKAGFVHLPSFDEMPLTESLRGMELIIKELIG